MASIDKRIDIKKFDQQTIERISSEIVQALTEIAREDPEAEGKFHIKFPYIKAKFSRHGHTEIIIGGPKPGEPEEPETPDEPGGR